LFGFNIFEPEFDDFSSRHFFGFLRMDSRNIIVIRGQYMRGFGNIRLRKAKKAPEGFFKKMGQEIQNAQPVQA